MGLLSKQKEDNSNQTAMPSSAPMAPPDLQTPVPDRPEQQNDGMADLPDLPPLDLPDLDDSENTSFNSQSDDSNENTDDTPSEEKTSSPMDSLDIPTDLDATEPVEEDATDTTDEIVEEPVAETPIDEAPIKESQSAVANRVQPQIVYNPSSPIFIEQQLYVDSLEDIYHAKAELVQIHKFTHLTRDLEEHIDDKFESYKSTLLHVQKKVLFMEKKLFEE